MKALQLIGQLFEVGAFLERKETTVVHKSADIRTRLLERLGKATDIEAKQDDALTLLEEIRGDGSSNPSSSAPTAGVGEPVGVAHTGDLTHTVSLIQTSNKNNGGAPSEITDVVSDFDKE